MKYLVVVLLFCTACHSGLLPCPKGSTAKIRKSSVRNSFHESYQSLLAKNEANRKDDPHYKASKNTEGKVIQNISVEEWDCPRPGTKKYLPKSVRENIKKNLQKIKSSSEPLKDK